MLGFFHSVFLFACREMTVRGHVHVINLLKNLLKCDSRSSSTPLEKF